jgi:A/G-specific adenine glycosylase
MELGAVVCTPRIPRCKVCPVAKFCSARRLGIADQLPNPGQRARTEARHIAVFLVKQGGRVLARQRPAGGVNAHFWELPQVELCGKPSVALVARETLGIRLLKAEPLHVVSHSITRYRIRAEVFAGELLRPLAYTRWLDAAGLRQKAFTGLDRKILRQPQRA